MKVAVLLGGNSEERDVSIASGAQIIKALRSLNIEVVAIDTSIGLLTEEQEKLILNHQVKKILPDITGFSLEKIELSAPWNNDALSNTDLYFLALHGGVGEDGTLQALLDLAGVAYTGSGHLASACAMDKETAKKIMAFHNIPTPPWIMASELDTLPVLEFDFPVVVKPSKQGSTVGLTIVKNAEKLETAINFSRKFDKNIIIEKFIAGRELTVGILDGKALAVGEIILPSDVEFDYTSKYQGAVQEIFPADIPSHINKVIKTYAEKVHAALKLSTYSRCDFRLDEDGNVWCLEVNSLPGMTEHSLFPKSAAAEGISFPELCRIICEITLRDRSKKLRDKAHVQKNDLKN